MSNANFQNYGSMAATNDFNFSPTEFFSLKENVQSSILFIKSKIQKFEKASKIIGTAKDSPTLREKMKQAQLTTNQKIQATNKDLQRLSFIVTRGGDKQQKVQVEMIISEYRHMVEKYFGVQKSLTQRLRMNFLVTDPNLEAGGSGTGDTDDSNYQESVQVTYDLEFEKTMLLQREQDFLTIESDISNINQMMNEISSLANQQGEHIESIENAVDHGAQNIERGAEELDKALAYQTKFRRKFALILLVIIVIAVILTLYFTLK